MGRVYLSLHPSIIVATLARMQMQFVPPTRPILFPPLTLLLRRLLLFMELN